MQKKAFYSVVGNCQDKAFAGILRTKVFYFYISVLLFNLLYSPPNVRFFFLAYLGSKVRNNYSNKGSCKYETRDWGEKENFKFSSVSC